MTAQTLKAELLPATREQNIATLTEVADDLVISITGEAEKQLANLQDQYSSDKIPANLSEKADYDEVHKAIQVIKKPRIALENSRKEVVSPLNTATKKINEAAKPLKESYLALEEPWKKKKKEHDDNVEIENREAIREEEERVDSILSRISLTETMPTTHINSDQSTLRSVLNNSFEGDGHFDWAEEFSEKARDIFAATKGKLGEMLKFRVEQDQFAQDKVDRERKEAGEKAQREAEERERFEAEQARQEADKKKQEERQAELDAQQAKIDAQNAEIEKQKREIAEAKEREERAAIDRVEAAKREKREAQKREESEKRAKVESEEQAAREKAEAEKRERVMEENRKREEKERLEKEEFIRANRNKVAKTVIPVLEPYCKSKKKAGELLVDIMDGNVDHLIFLVSLKPHIDG